MSAMHWRACHKGSYQPTEFLLNQNTTYSRDFQRSPDAVLTPRRSNNKGNSPRCQEVSQYLTELFLRGILQLLACMLSVSGNLPKHDG